MKSVYSWDHSRESIDFSDIYNNSQGSNLDDPLYYLTMALFRDASPMHKCSKISNSNNSNSLVFYNMKNIVCEKIPGIMHNNPKLEYIQSSILGGDITNVDSKTTKFKVLYSEEIGYARIYGFIPSVHKNNIHILSIQVNGITVFYTNIINQSPENAFEEYMNNCNMYIEQEYAIEKYSTIYIITRSSMLIEKLGIDKNTKFISVEIQYCATEKSTLTKIKNFKSIVMSQETTMDDDLCDGYESIPDYCYASDMGNPELTATKFKPEKDCHIYRLIQDSKKKGIKINRDCTKNCAYMNQSNKKDV